MKTVIELALPSLKISSVKCPQKFKYLLKRQKSLYKCPSGHFPELSGHSPAGPSPGSIPNLVYEKMVKNFFVLFWVFFLGKNNHFLLRFHF